MVYRHYEHFELRTVRGYEDPRSVNKVRNSRNRSPSTTTLSREDRPRRTITRDPLYTAPTSTYSTCYSVLDRVTLGRNVSQMPMRGRPSASPAVRNLAIRNPAPVPRNMRPALNRIPRISRGLTIERPRFFINDARQEYSDRVIRGDYERQPEVRAATEAAAEAAAIREQQEQDAIAARRASNFVGEARNMEHRSGEVDLEAEHEARYDEWYNEWLDVYGFERQTSPRSLVNTLFVVFVLPSGFANWKMTTVLSVGVL
ncbi:hypothetical protein NHQ30_000453 [Ciborinia camelliae]|nr:hypothetical protein NHQ30_000453 [Ciborinia camelliae]